ncbi:hypothetical protein NX773_09505 [Massilia solisilvae]|uniref:Secreted protein n=1 Tax=Massilia solisilvae TaxID=1811225 RepID=A0ABT2BIQ4_9BURK|nr:hypothetical protein [Massilia solisilvae]MCS0608396.1 hypothetical protein [Massilia solisilvae]
MSYRRTVAAVALFLISSAASGVESDKPPRFLTVPVLGLRLPLDKINVEAFPEDLRITCRQLNDEYVTSRVWIFGQARDAASTYYVLTGYFKRLNKAPGQRLYEYWDNGAVYTVTGRKCGGDDARETFEVYDPNAANDGNVPDPILRELARDLAARTVRAFGGPDRLRAEITSQRIDFNSLPVELQEAFSPFFGK